MRPKILAIGRQMYIPTMVSLIRYFWFSWVVDDGKAEVLLKKEEKTILVGDLANFIGYLSIVLADENPGWLAIVPTTGEATKLATEEGANRIFLEPGLAGEECKVKQALPQRVAVATYFDAVPKPDEIISWMQKVGFPPSESAP